VNPEMDRRPTDRTVTKESIRMTSSRRRFTHFVSAINPFAADGGDSDSPSAGTAGVEPSNGRTHGGRVAGLLAGPRTLRCAVFAAAVLVLGAVEASPAFAAQPWWGINASVRPAVLPTGGEATIVARGVNLGDAPTSIAKTVEVEFEEEGVIKTKLVQVPASRTLTLTLPAGVELVEEGGIPQVSFLVYSNGHSTLRNSDIGLTSLKGRIGKYCSVTGQQITCNTEPAPPLNEPANEGYESFLVPPLAPYEYLEVVAKVRDSGAGAGAPYTVEVGGGGAATVTRSRALPIGTSPASYGAEDYALVPEEEGGGVDSRAGSHPFQLTTTFNLNQTADPAVPPALARDLHFKLPPGQLGNVTALPKCTIAQFSTLLVGNINICPADTAIGVATVTLDEARNIGVDTVAVPLFNLETAPGEPARFGFLPLGTPIILGTSVRSGVGEDYGVTVSPTDISQAANLISSTVSFWGAPGDPRHDESRGWECVASGFYSGEAGPCNPKDQAHPPAFLTLPTNCTAPFATSVEGLSWPNKFFPAGAPLAPLSYSLVDAAGTPVGLVGCNQLPFSPRIESEPTSDAATSPTGLSFDIDVADEGLLNAEGSAQSQLKKAVVTLPQGFTTNPSVAEGLKACGQAQYEGSTLATEGCPEESKIGEVEIESPLVEPTLHGSLYVARQKENPYGNLLTIYMVAKNAEVGVIVKQALKVIPDPVTGQLTTEVDDVPQLPFSRFHLSFRQGQRSPLVTPPTCGPYTVNAELYPWSNPTEAVHDSSSFQITQGPEGLGCPSGSVPPFHPGLEAGTINNAAGTYSPFYTHITRKDSEQEITRFSIKLPTGLLAKLKGVSECSDAGVAAAKAREHEGGATEEEASPSCPKNSEVGHTLVGTGVGNVLAYAGGKLYLAGPYHGSPLSLVSVNDAKVGPFDLGTVVVRFAIDINHETAEVSVDGANSDPIPHIVDGIPIHLRDIRAYVSRSNFTLNPTSCAKKSTAATVLGSGANFVSSADDVPVAVSSPFQAADCASLGFAPRLALSLTGKKTHRGALPAFEAVLTYPKGGAYANIAAAQVTLPPSEFLEQGHLKNVCTRKQFESGTVFGENCPKNSIYGKARAVTPLLDQPLEGPVYLRTGYGTKLPELAAALNGPQISIDLAGKIDSVHVKGTEGSRIRNTFSLVPDAPVEKFTLELKGGKKGLLVNSTDVCKGTHKALAAFTGQNGKLHEFEPALKAQCGKGGGKKKSAGKKQSKGSKGKGGK
jgi:hypothetical protein